MRSLKKYFIPSILLLSIGWFAFTPGDRYFEILKNLDIFASLFKEVNALYVDEVDPESMMRTGMDAMLESLDPYTTYIPEEDADDFRMMTTGQYAGIGSVIGNIGERIVIKMPYENFAAHTAGIEIGDEILKINGTSVTGKDVWEVSDLLKGPVSSDIVIEVNRYGHEDPLKISFKREKIEVLNVPYSGMISNGIGYIRLKDFTVGAGREVAEAVETLKSNGAKKFILDLRGNPGGLLSEAVNVVNVFIPRNKKVVETRGRVAEWNKVYKTLDNPLDTKAPLIVLVDGKSASASEIVSGAIQDYDRGLLIGRQTFGKGLVQTSRQLSYDAQLKITTAKYYTPSGRCIQAIDYRHRNNEGEGTDIPDSLKIAYKTMSGRTVYDGEGLHPDIIITKDEPAPVVQELVNGGYIFDYASKWVFDNPDKEKFAENDEEFDSFHQWLNTKTFSYQTKVEALIEQLESSAEQEAYLKYLNDEIAQLQMAVERDKKNDLNKFKTEILEMLETEIASRNFLVKGMIISTFDNDPDILKAVDLLDKEKINQILSRN